jgi:hypothetical protein
VAKKRKDIPVGTRRLVLHEAGYRCANPACRTILTLDIHHLEYVSEGGGDEPENLLPLCPNCHSLHHQGNIPRESVRGWKMLLISLNEALDRRAVDLLLTLDILGGIPVSPDGLLHCSPVLGSRLAKVGGVEPSMYAGIAYRVVLTEKGKLFVESWKKGDQRAAILGLTPGQETPKPGDEGGSEAEEGKPSARPPGQAEPAKMGKW